MSTPTPDRRARKDSMSLLNEIIFNPVEPGYAQAKLERGDHDGPQERKPLINAGLLIAALICGFILIIAVMALRVPDSLGRESTADYLITRINEQQELAEELSVELSELTETNAQLQQDSLLLTMPEVDNKLAELGAAASTTPLTGPGIRITIQDGAPVSDSPTDHLVKDVDLQRMVNSLFAVGAEAVAINGQRIGPLTSIRNVGTQTIMIDLAAITAPYEIVAIGDPATMQNEIVVSAGWRYFGALRSAYGMTAQVVTARDLNVPGASSRSLFSAGAVPGYNARKELLDLDDRFEGEEASQ